MCYLKENKERGFKPKIQTFFKRVESYMSFFKTLPF